MPALSEADYEARAYPELAAKITLARLAEGAADPHELLTIAFTCAEYARLLARAPVPSWQTPEIPDPAPTGEDRDRTIADIEAFLKAA